MKKQTLVIALILTFAATVFAQKTIRRNVYFETNKSTVSTESQSYLRALTDSLKKYPSIRIELKGHTDADGSDNFNQSLSEKRVKNVKIALENNGISKEQITIAALGESLPITENTTFEGKQLNRRVEILITFFPPNSETAQTSSIKSYRNVLQLFADLGQPLQYFKINTGRDTTIKGKKGTILTIKKDAFKDVPTNAIVDFRLKEAYSFSDIIAENLTTHSGDKQLQTGGMYYADALFNNEPLTLKKDLEVIFPTRESQADGMQLFTGERDMKQNGRIDWKPIKKTPNPESESFSDIITVYSNEQGFDPYTINYNDGPMTFKEVFETDNVFPLFSKDVSKGKKELVVRKDLNKCGTAMALYVQSKPELQNEPLLSLHKIVFKDLYDYYEAQTFKDLQGKDGISWDSLIHVRLEFIKQGMVPEERWALRKDSLQRMAKKEKLEQKEYERLKRKLDYEIAQEKKAREVMNVRINFGDGNPVTGNSIFPMPKLGWTNIDRYYRQYNASDFIDIDTNVPSSTKDCNVFLILKTEKAAWFNEGRSISENCNFQQVPKDKEAFIVGMKVENGKSYLAIYPFKTEKGKVNLDFKALSSNEIKKQLEILNN
jgi:hypothetical protein